MKAQFFVVHFGEEIEGGKPREVCKSLGTALAVTNYIPSVLLMKSRSVLTLRSFSHQNAKLLFKISYFRLFVCNKYPSHA